MLLLDVHHEDAAPVYRQICTQVARLVDEGALAPGSRLPASRALAGTLGVHRSTVVRAYQELWALGYLESRPGSYSTVRARLRPAAPAPAGSALDWGAAASPLAEASFAAVQAVTRSLRKPARPRFDFSGLAADRALCPTAELRRAVRHALLEEGVALLDYGEAAGYRPLRESVAQRLRVHGVQASAEEILITNGAQHGLDLALRLLAPPGSTIAVESPTYAMALPLLKLHGLEVAPLPMTAEGADLDALAAALGRGGIRLVYTIPNFHNPTGVTTSQAHRERLLELCERSGVPIVEDGFEEEMKYFGKAVLPIKSMDSRGIVLYLGTFSKVVFPGLRVGWIAADRAAVERLTALKRASSLSGNTLTQAAVTRFVATGGYEPTLRRIHVAYRRRMLVALKALREALPAGPVRWSEPVGGYTLWVEIPGLAAAEEGRLAEALAEESVAVAPGTPFFPGPTPHLCFRLSIANCTEAQIAEGIARLGRVVRRLPGV